MTAAGTDQTAARIHQLIVQTEIPLRLIPEQQSGISCVWCLNPLYDGLETVALDEASRGLRGCARCYTARVETLETYYAWLNHCSACAYCRDGGACTVSFGYRALHQAAARVIGRPPPLCSGCFAEVQADEVLIPKLREGGSATHLSYFHARCPRRRR
ncbi:hypothetical protein ACWDO7_24705 [Streptomyces sp. NPDC003656]